MANTVIGKARIFTAGIREIKNVASVAKPVGGVVELTTLRGEENTSREYVRQADVQRVVAEENGTQTYYVTSDRAPTTKLSIQVVSVSVNTDGNVEVVDAKGVTHVAQVGMVDLDLKIAKTGRKAAKKAPAKKAPAKAPAKKAVKKRK